MVTIHCQTLLLSAQGGVAPLLRAVNRVSDPSLFLCIFELGLMAEVGVLGKTDWGMME